MCHVLLVYWYYMYFGYSVSPLSPFQWPQNIWPWMTLMGYLALNSVFAPVWLADTARLQKIIAWKLIKIDTYCQRCKSSARTLVSGDIRFVRIFGRILYRKKTLKDSVVGHALTLVLYASTSRKRFEIRPKLLLMTNRKLHMRFRLAPRSMTLNCYKFEFSRNFAWFRRFERQQRQNEWR